LPFLKFVFQIGSHAFVIAGPRRWSSCLHPKYLGL
jgi:hypothetical protein